MADLFDEDEGSANIEIVPAEGLVFTSLSLLTSHFLLTSYFFLLTSFPFLVLLFTAVRVCAYE